MFDWFSIVCLMHLLWMAKVKLDARSCKLEKHIL
jgi:hypothetical protein